MSQNKQAMLGMVAVGLLVYAVLPNSGSGNTGPRPFDAADAMVAVRQVLVDPGSAQFERLYAGQGNAMCGLVNAKNRLGGYTGRRRFVASKAGLVLVDNSSTGFQQVWQGHCE